MKKLLSIIVALLVIVPSLVFAEDDNLVKVYIFEAGGCPYCEKEITYLKGLDSYEKKFVIVQKELYVDHIDWETGKDFELGKNVADLFLAAGFSDASYQATPFVVISDLYAAATYSESLESIIDQAYEEGDKDVVQCVADGKDNCLTTSAKSDSNSGSSNTAVIITALVCVVIYLIKSTYDRVVVTRLLNENADRIAQVEKKITKETKSKK